MNLTDDQIVRFLIDKYKQEGKDLSFVLSDSVFKQLPLGAKVEALKKYSAELAAGTKASNGRDWLSMGQTAAITGVPAFLAARKVITPERVEEMAKAVGYKNGLSRANHLSYARGGLAAAGIFAALAGAGIAGLTARDVLINKAKLKKNLDNLANNPTDEQSLGVLSSYDRLSADKIEANPLLNRLRTSLGPRLASDIPNHALRVVENTLAAQAKHDLARYGAGE